MNRTALISGAHTQLGNALVEAFARAGWRVVAHVDHSAPVALPQGVAVERGALGAAAEILSRHGPIAAVVHAEDASDGRVAVPQLHAAIALARAADARLMLPGTLRNYRLPAASPIAETLPQGATTPSGALAMLLEATLSGACAHGVRGVVLRAGTLIGGARPRGWFDRVIVRGLQGGTVRYPGPLDRVHAWQDVEDLAGFYVRVAEREADLPAFARFHVSGVSVTGEALVAAIDRAAFRLGLIHPAETVGVARMPWWVLSLLGRLVPRWRALLDTRDAWQQPHALDGTALQAWLGDATPPSRPLNHTVERALRRAPRFRRALQLDPPPLRARAI